MSTTPAGAPSAQAAQPDGVAALELRNIHTFYGHIHAIKGVSLRVNPGEIVTLIGANGAGKTTTLRTISGIVQPREGQVIFNGQRIDRVPPHRIVEMGVCQSPEGRRIFSRMSVQENLEMGAFARRDAAGVREDLERTLELFPRLKERLKQRGGTLSGGEQQMLAIGRALMSRPRILLLDEPSMGLAPMLVETIFSTIVQINRQGVAVLLVEQNALMALNVANRGYVLETGRIVLEDDASALQRNEQVQKAYLGIE
jgi:branched-chain amino acid transport system ATP-binding protein